MSWLVGALQASGGLTDMAGTIGGIVYQQQHVHQLKRQNDLQLEWMRRNEQLQRDAMQMTWDLSTQAPSLRVKEALAAGFDPLSARQLAGSSERRISGYLEQPIRTIGEAVATRSTGNLATMSNAMQTFQQGSPFGMRAPAGFANPNYQPRPNPPRVNLGPRPPVSNV
uniref:VP2 capsid n=1 Tax=California sea lion sapovirus 1 TaxID=1073970 RepID=G1JYZ1_9CALI|nr:VP2 capsid [California sea lion sapovirus 1]